MKRTQDTPDALQRATMTLSMAMACGFTVEQAAKQAGVSEAEALKLVKDPAFAGEVDRVREGMVERCSGMLTAAGIEAVKTLLTLQGPGNPPGTRLGAARAVLELGMRVRDLTALGELVGRVAALEGKSIS